MTKQRKIYDIYRDEWVDELPEYEYCPLCGDAGVPKGSECRRVKAARANGAPLPFDPKTGERHE